MRTDNGTTQVDIRGRNVEGKWNVFLSTGGVLKVITSLTDEEMVELRDAIDAHLETEAHRDA